MKKRRNRILTLLLAGTMFMGSVVPQTFEPKIAMAQTVTPQIATTQNVTEQNVVEQDIQTQDQMEDLTGAAATSTICFKDEKLYTAVKAQLTDDQINYTDKGQASDTYVLTMEASEIAKVKELKLSSKSITDLSGIQQFKSLESLNLSYNSLKDITVLSSMRTLKELNLHGCGLKDSDMAAIAGLTQMNELSISDNNLTSLNAIKNMTELVKLEIAANNISDLSPVASMTNLEDLYAGSVVRSSQLGYGNPIKSIEPLKGLQNLRVLGLDNCKLTSFDITGNKWSKLRVLDIHENEIADISSLTAAQLPKLQELYLAANQIKEVSNIYDISTLKVLCVASNYLDNEDLTGISKLTDLRKLSLGIEINAWSGSTMWGWDDARRSNQFTDFTEVKKCNSLEELSVSGLSLTSVDQFLTMENLEELDAQENHIAKATVPSGSIDCIWLDNQRVSANVASSVAKVDLSKYELFYQALQTDNYYSTGKNYYLYNCTLSEDKRYLILDKGAAQAELRLQSGKASNSTLYVKVGEVSIQEADVATVDCIYNGKEQKPAVKVIYNGSELVEGTDYTLSYANNKIVGLGTITVTGMGAFTGSTTVHFYILPKQVTGMKFASKTSSVTLSWKAVTGATGYQIYQYDSSSKKWKKKSTVTKNQVVLEKLSSGTTYKYKVRAIAKIDSKTKAGKCSSTLTTTTRPSKPALTVKAGTKKAALSWKKIKGASGYCIYMSTKKNGTYKRVKHITKGSTVSYKKTKLKKGKTYYFKIRAYRKIGTKNYYSSYSTIQKVKITK